MLPLLAKKPRYGLGGLRAAGSRERTGSEDESAEEEWSTCSEDESAEGEWSTGSEGESAEEEEPTGSEGESESD
jgi:hypothetical protein